MKAGGEGTTEDEVVDGITDSIRHEFEQALGVVMDREAWHAAVNRVTENQT